MKVIWETQKAIYNTLSSQSTGITKPIAGIFYSTPDNTKTPYVVIGNIKTENISDFSNEVHKIKATINVFDEKVSNENILSIMEEVKNTLLKIDDLTAENYEFLEAMQLDASIEPVEDGKNWCGKLNFEFYAKSK